MTLRTFDLFEGLDIVVLGAVHNGEDFGHEMGLISRPMTARTSIKWLQGDSSPYFWTYERIGLLD